MAINQSFRIRVLVEKIRKVYDGEWAGHEVRLYATYSREPS